MARYGKTTKSNKSKSAKRVSRPNFSRRPFPGGRQNTPTSLPTLEPTMKPIVEPTPSTPPSLPTLEPTMTPIVEPTTKLTANDVAADDRFGRSVGIYNDTMIVGALYDGNDTFVDSGYAYIFVRNAANNWTEQTKLVASDEEAGDVFGYSVGIVIVGAYRGGNDNSYIFVRDATNNWLEQVKLEVAPKMSLPVQNRFIAIVEVDCDHFGSSHQIHLDTAIAFVGACDVKGADSRSVWISVTDAGVANG